MADRNDPGHTQLTRIPSCAYSTAATLASWITAAFVAQYGAACDHAVSPETEAVSTIEPEFCGRMTPTAARMPLTAPRTLTRNARSHSSVARLWIRPLDESTPALLISTSRRPKRFIAKATTDSTWSKSLTSASAVSTPPAASGRPATVASSEGALRSLSTRSVWGSPARRCETAAPRAPPAPLITITRRGAVIGAPGHDPVNSVGWDIALVLIVPTSTLQTVTAGPSYASGRPPADLLEMYRRMLGIRGFEERVSALYRDGEVPGFVHLSIGQEAAAVGACWPLRPSDIITSTHRGHGHCLAKGLEPLGMFAELMGKDQGTNRGRGGSMHIADPTLGIFGANGIVAAGVPIAVGAATASQLRADGGVAVAFFGDGAPAQGAFHEAMNLAAVWHLPVVFFCENNGYAEFSPASTQHGASLERRAAGYGIPYVAVDGNDVVATAAAMEDAVDAVRSGGGPVVVEAATFRWHGHYEGDPERYRTQEEVEEWKARDPLLVHEALLRAGGVGDDELKTMESTVAASSMTPSRRLGCWPIRTGPP